MRIIENVGKKVSSETFVKDTIFSRKGGIIALSVASMGFLVGLGVESIWAFKAPAFVGGAWIAIEAIFGKADPRWSNPVSKEKSVKFKILTRFSFRES